MNLLIGTATLGPEPEQEGIIQPDSILNDVIAGVIVGLIILFLTPIVAWVLSRKARKWLNAKLFWIYIQALRAWHWLNVVRDPKTFRPLKPFIAPKPKGIEGEDVRKQAAASCIGSPSSLPPLPRWNSFTPRNVPLSAVDLKGQSSAPPLFKLEYEKKGDRLLNERGYVIRLVNYGKGDAHDVRLDPVDSIAPTAPTHWDVIPSDRQETFQLEPHAHQYRFVTRFKLSYVEASTGKRTAPIEIELPPEDA